MELRLKQAVGNSGCRKYWGAVSADNARSKVIDERSNLHLWKPLPGRLSAIAAAGKERTKWEFYKRTIGSWKRVREGCPIC